MLETFLATHNFSIIQFLLVGIGYLMPFPLAFAAFHLWHHYRQEKFIAGIKWILLEVQVPREINKTPAAMELIFSNAMYHQSMKGFWEEFIIGAPWLWFSLEIASIDGQVHFFVRTPSRIRNLVETQIYGQYPQAKVIEVDDYVFHVDQYKKDGDWYVWGCEFMKKREDFLPIKTWKDFGDDMKTGQKEEFKIDPITPTIEYLGSLKKGQQLWMQIIIRQNIKKYHSHHTGKHVGFQEGAIEFIHELLMPYTRAQQNERADGSKGELGADVRTPDFLKPTIKSISDNMTQLHFDVGIRVVCLSRKDLISEDEFNNLRRNVRLIFRQFAQPGVNELWRVNSTQFDAPWSDPTGLALTKMKKRMLDYYRLRVMFHPPIQYAFDYPKLLSIFFPSYSPKIFVMSIQEISTIFHFPGMVSETPSFKRIESKIAKPPSNLPL
jgi:hypothetical protein